MARPKLVEEYIERVEARLEELRPQVEEAMELQRALDALKASEGTTRRLSAEARKRQILDLLARSPSMRVRDIAQTLGVTDSRVTQLLKAMEAEGSIARKAGRIKRSA